MNGHYTYIFFTCLPLNILVLMGGYVSSWRACFYRTTEGWVSRVARCLAGPGRGLDEKLVAYGRNGRGLDERLIHEGGEAGAVGRSYFTRVHVWI